MTGNEQICVSKSASNSNTESYLDVANLATNIGRVENINDSLQVSRLDTEIGEDRAELADERVVLDGADRHRGVHRAHVAASVRADAAVRAAERGAKERHEVVRQPRRLHGILRVGKVGRASRNLAIEVIDQIAARRQQRFDRLVDDGADETSVV